MSHNVWDENTEDGMHPSRKSRVDFLKEAVMPELNLKAQQQRKVQGRHLDREATSAMTRRCELQETRQTWRGSLSSHSLGLPGW